MAAPNVMQIFREILWPLAAVVAAFLVGGIIVLLLGDDPINAYDYFVKFIRFHP